MGTLSVAATFVLAETCDPIEMASAERNNWRPESMPNCAAVAAWSAAATATGPKSARPIGASNPTYSKRKKENDKKKFL